MRRAPNPKMNFRSTIGGFYARLSGRSSNRSHLPFFSESWYRAAYLRDQPDADPISHYIAFSKTGMFDPHPLFDSSYYIEQYPECLSSSKSVVEYFAEIGLQASHNPNPFFDAEFYNKNNPDVAATTPNYFDHYINHGWRERRSTHPLFDHAWYIESNPDVARDGVDGLEHYLRSGIVEGRDPHILLDIDFLRRHVEAPAISNKELVLRYLDSSEFWQIDPCESFEAKVYSRESGIDIKNTHPLLHYMIHGAYKTNPNSIFDTSFYINQYADIASVGANPLVHYLKAGAREGRNPSRTFDTKWYQDHNPDVIESGLNPLSHFLRFGRAEGRIGSPTPTAENSATSGFDPRMLSTVKGRAFLRSGATLSFPNHKSPVVSIILVLYNKYYLTSECLQSIYLNVDYDACPYEIIIYDNGSFDETATLKTRIKNVKWIEDSKNSGFIEGVNNAFEHAGSELLLLLNNDTYVLNGSLERAVALIDADRTIGVVGAKLIFPTGLLQEAGSIIWNDGSCFGYCRDSSPEISEANFQRDVDYVSGAFFLTRTDLFRRFGMLDPIYKPAYYEETDYCTKLRSQQFRIVYDPFVEIIHAEFGSADKKSDSILRQQKNQVLFVKRHKSIAEKFEPSLRNVVKARYATSGRPKVLVVDDKIPHDYLGSGFPRSRTLIGELSKSDFDLTFVPTNDVAQEWSAVRQTLDVRIEVIFGLNGDAIVDHLKERKGYYDAIVVSRPHNMVRIRRAIEQGVIDRRSTYIIYDAEALFTHRDVLQSKVEGIHIDQRTVDSLVEAEINISKDADLILSVSDAELGFFRKYGKDTMLLGHALVPEPTSRPFSERKDLLFVGSLADSNTPNTDSVLWFLREVFPVIRRRVPDCRLHLVGDVKSKAVRELATSGVVLHGRVDDIEPIYDACKIFIAPTRFAAGIPHKVHEAAAHGLPCVTTILLANQLGWKDEVELLCSDDPSAFADRCLTLYRSESVWRTVRENALRAVARDCSPESFASTVGILSGQIRKAYHDKE
ncbi:glycosyltransferase [Methylobacterium currus]|uniref:glycosyltransferase n=1 Tax=Methylobacterium currus TaxID=2051553 RepID=UPI001E2D0F2C|nr:glycosyltransferase [Methylobacterium currus]UHC15234.1 glycosyltransferase [Methylobacterium currus]